VPQRSMSRRWSIERRASVRIALGKRSPPYRRVHGDVQGEWPHAGRDGQDDDQARAAGVEGIDRDDQHRPPSSLFVPEGRVEVGQLSPRWGDVTLLRNCFPAVRVGERPCPRSSAAQGPGRPSASRPTLSAPFPLPPRLPGRPAARRSRRYQVKHPDVVGWPCCGTALPSRPAPPDGSGEPSHRPPPTHKQPRPTA
jgi:hypothetical protein